MAPWCPPGCPISPFLPPWCLAGCPISPFLLPWCLPGASQAVQMILACLPGASLRDDAVLSCGLLAPLGGFFRWPLAVSQASKIKSGLGRLLESVGLALADYWSHLVLPWQITGVTQSPSWRRRAESVSKGSRGTDSSSQARRSWLATRGRNPISDGRNFSTPSMANSRAHRKS